jgi:hypothetical protein
MLESSLYSKGAVMRAISFKKFGEAIAVSLLGSCARQFK